MRDIRQAWENHKFDGHEVKSYTQNTGTQSDLVNRHFACVSSGRSHCVNIMPNVTWKKTRDSFAKSSYRSNVKLHRPWYGRGFDNTSTSFRYLIFDPNDLITVPLSFPELFEIYKCLVTTFIIDSSLTIDDRVNVWPISDSASNYSPCKLHTLSKLIRGNNITINPTATWLDHCRITDSALTRAKIRFL